MQQACAQQKCNRFKFEIWKSNTKWPPSAPSIPSRLFVQGSHEPQSIARMPILNSTNAVRAHSSHLLCRFLLGAVLGNFINLLGWACSLPPKFGNTDWFLLFEIIQKKFEHDWNDSQTSLNISILKFCSAKSCAYYIWKNLIQIRCASSSSNSSAGGWGWSRTSIHKSIAVAMQKDLRFRFTGYIYLYYRYLMNEIVGTCWDTNNFYNMTFSDFFHCPSLSHKGTDTWPTTKSLWS